MMIATLSGAPDTGKSGLTNELIARAMYAGYTFAHYRVTGPASEDWYCDWRSSVVGKDPDLIVIEGLSDDDVHTAARALRERFS